MARRGRIALCPARALSRFLSIILDPIRYRTVRYIRYTLRSQFFRKRVTAFVSRFLTESHTIVVGKHT